MSSCAVLLKSFRINKLCGSRACISLYCPKRKFSRCRTAQVGVTALSPYGIHRSSRISPCVNALSLRCYSTEDNDSQPEKLLYVGKDRNNLKWMLGSFYCVSAVVGIYSTTLLSSADISLAVMIVVGINVCVFVFVNPYLLYQLGKRYVGRLYHNSITDTYTVETLSPFVMKDANMKFTAKDCKMPSGPTMFTSFIAKGRSLFVNSDLMTYKDYAHMLRYAEGLDYENPDRQKSYDEAVKTAVAKKQEAATDDS